MSASNPLSQNFLLLWRLSKVSRLGNRSPEQGLTIMECLVAILLIGLTVAMVTPPLLIATATRVQNRRAEQAIQLAQDEIDRINTLVQQGNHESQRLPAVVNAANLKIVGPPTGLANQLKTTRRDGAACPPGSPFNGASRYTNQQIPANQAIPIDVDGDCRPEFFMQIFRTRGTLLQAELDEPPNEQRPARFEVGIRVYSYPLAQPNLGALNPQPEPAPLLISDRQSRKQSENPMVVVYKQMIWGEQADVVCESVSKSIDTCPQ